MMTESELRKLIREEIENIEESKSPDQMRLDDAKLAIISLSQAADMMRRVGSTNSAAREMAQKLDDMVKQLQDQIIPSVESMAKGTFTSRLGAELGRLGRSIRSV